MVKERMEADISESEKIFNVTKRSARRRDIGNCCRIREREIKKGLLLVGMFSELAKTELLDSARKLQHTAYKDISIGPDQTKKQGLLKRN
jgi:hypothetical protein